MQHLEVALARTADSLTLARFVIAIVLVGVVAGQRFALGAWLLAAAWVSDAVDGRSARASGHPTHLGHLDLAVDTSVGAALLIGLAWAGLVPFALVGPLVLLLGGGFLILANPTPALALQGVAYGWFLVLLWGAEPAARWVPLVTAAALLTIGFRRLLTMVVPAFLSGVAALVRPTPQDGTDDRDRTGG